MLESCWPESIIEEEKLKFFASKISIWEFFNVSESTYRAYSFDEKTRLPTKYYSELYENYYGAGNYFFFLFCLLLLTIFCLYLSLMAALFFFSLLMKKKIILFRFVCNVN